MSKLDWTVLSEGDVMSIAGRAAAKVARDYPSTIEADDAQQEALIILASDARNVRACLRDPDLGSGVLYTRLVRDLIDKVKTEAKYRSRHVSYERLREGAE